MSTEKRTKADVILERLDQLDSRMSTIERLAGQMQGRCDASEARVTAMHNRLAEAEYRISCTEATLAHPKPMASTDQPAPQAAPPQSAQPQAAQQQTHELPPHLQYPHTTDPTQQQILRELRIQNKRAGFSWGRVMALLLLVLVGLPFLLAMLGF